MKQGSREDRTTEARLNQQVRKDNEGEDPAEPEETASDSSTAKDINVVRGDDRSQSVRHSG